MRCRRENGGARLSLQPCSAIPGRSRGEPAILEIKRVEHIGATARPPDVIATRSDGQAEPALIDDLAVDDFSFVQIDERELVRVVAGRGGKCMAVAGQWDDVEREVGEGDRASGWFQGPAVREEEAVVSRACVARLLLGQRSAHSDRSPNQES